MSFDALPPELVLQVFLSCSSVADVLNLALTCRRFHHVSSASQKLTILASAAEVEYGPMKDIIQVITQNASQPAHTIRAAPLSINLLQQVVHVGRVAKKWEEIYPIKKWKVDFENRRLLTSSERYLVRRAIYRLWLYTRSFHTSSFPRTSRMVSSVVRGRAELLHNWSTADLAEIEDVRLIIRDVVENHICPSNGTIQRKFLKRYPDSASQTLSFNIHLNYPLTSSSYFPPLAQRTPTNPLGSSRAQQRESALPPPLEDNKDNPFFCMHPRGTNNNLPPRHSITSYNANNRQNKYATRFRYDLYHDPGVEGWGDEIPHYYVIEDMLKLDPGQVLWLRENALLKEEVEAYVRSMGEWFENNGETFSQTLEWVLNERGDDVLSFRETLFDGEIGVAVD